MLLGLKSYKSLPKLWQNWNQEPLPLWTAKLVLDRGKTDPSASSQVAALSTPWRLGCAAGLNDAEVQGKGWFWFCDNGMVRGSSWPAVYEGQLPDTEVGMQSHQGRPLPLLMNKYTHRHKRIHKVSHTQQSCSLLLHCCNRPGRLGGLCIAILAETWVVSIS